MQISLIEVSNEHYQPIILRKIQAPNTASFAWDIINFDSYTASEIGLQSTMFVPTQTPGPSATVTLMS